MKTEASLLKFPSVCCAVQLSEKRLTILKAISSRPELLLLPLACGIQNYYVQNLQQSQQKKQTK